MCRPIRFFTIVFLSGCWLQPITNMLAIANWDHDQNRIQTTEWQARSQACLVTVLYVTVSWNYPYHLLFPIFSVKQMIFEVFWGHGLLERWRGEVIDARSIAGGLAAKLLQGCEKIWKLFQPWMTGWWLSHPYEQTCYGKLGSESQKRWEITQKMLETLKPQTKCMLNVKPGW